jgi:Mitochondrial biogenesis AIM24
MRLGEALDVREHQFLAATDGVDYTFTRVKGASNVLFGGTGFFIDTFTCAGSEGILWLHGYGNVFELTLGPGEQIDVEPGGWIYKSRSVKMETIFQKDCLRAPASSSGTGSRGRGASRYSPCTFTFRPRANGGDPELDGGCIIVLTAPSHRGRPCRPMLQLRHATRGACHE